jgi:hypothetical protein
VVPDNADLVAKAPTDAQVTVGNVVVLIRHVNLLRIQYRSLETKVLGSHLAPGKRAAYCPTSRALADHERTRRCRPTLFL